MFIVKEDFCEREFHSIQDLQGYLGAIKKSHLTLFKRTPEKSTKMLFVSIVEGCITETYGKQNVLSTEDITLFYLDE